mgnify:CR=1 FL=1
MFRDWDTTIVTEHSRYTATWNCKNTDKEVDQNIKVKLTKQKTHPEENYRYEGTVNGKEVTGIFITGHAPTKGVDPVNDEVKLTKAERVAGIAHINWMT